jgi:hypothetical protein
MPTRYLAAILAMAVIGSAEAAPVSRFALYDNGTNEWCSYNSKARFDTAVQKRQALQVVQLSAEKGNPAKLEVTEEGESGDWIVYDTYGFDQAGALISAKRIINDVSSNEQVVEAYAIQNGRARRTSSRLNDLSGKPKSGKPEWVPEVPLIETLSSASFYPLIAKPVTERCIKAK